MNKKFVVWGLIVSLLGMVTLVGCPVEEEAPKVVEAKYRGTFVRSEGEPNKVVISENRIDYRLHDKDRSDKAWTVGATLYYIFDGWEYEFGTFSDVDTLDVGGQQSYTREK